MIYVEGFGFMAPEERQTVGMDHGFAGVASSPPVYKATLELVMDEEGAGRFLAAMEQLCPGFGRDHRSAVPTSATALPSGARALPSGPIEAEFIDE